jgi:hypothetical protein
VDNNILLITHPDKVHNQNISIFLIYPTKDIKNQVHNILAMYEQALNVYIYEPTFEEEFNTDWVLDVSRFSDYVIIDIDNSTSHIRDIASYLVSLPNVFWLTSADNTCYTKLSVNRIYDLEILNKIGGNFEE